MEICIRWGFKESVHLSLSILPIQQSIDKYFEPQSLFSRHQQGSRMVSAGISIALCNKRNCSFTWKQCLIFMRMTALYNYRTTTWPLSDSIKSIGQPRAKKPPKPKAFVLESLAAGCSDVLRPCFGNGGTRLQRMWQPACSSVCWSDGETPASFNELWTSLDAAGSSPKWMKSIVLSVHVWEERVKTRLQSCSDLLHQRWVWLLGFKTIFCFKAQSGMWGNIRWQQGWGSGCSHYSRRPSAWKAFYSRKKQASRHRLVPWGAGSLISDRTEWMTSSPNSTFLFRFAFLGWHFPFWVAIFL